MTEVEYWILGAITAVLLFASVLIHELAHSFVALARGLQAKSITLFIFGGVSNLSGEAKKPSTEFLVAIVGPLTSFALAGIAFVLGSTFNQPHWDLVISYLFLINLVLGIFNLVPGFPLDGGRVLRSILWQATGNNRKATTWAANVGKVVAYLMFAYAAYQILNDNNFIGGLWTAAIAWFLHQAASASVEQLVFETRMRRVRVRDIVRADPTVIAPDLTVAQLVDQYILPTARRAVPVEENGLLTGIVTVSDIAKVPAEQRTNVRVDEVMGGKEKLFTVQADSPVMQAFSLLSEHDLEQLPVLDGIEYIGLLTRRDVARQLELRQALDV
jgi:Zn-dependent protease/CBS domain-containing protein